MTRWKDTLRRFMARIWDLLLVAFGIAVLAATLLLTPLLDRKDVALAVAMIGASIGTGLLTIYLPRLFSAAGAQEAERRWTATSSRKQLRQTEQERDDARRQRAEAERQIARLEAMRINIDAFQPILNLGLLEVETSLTDFQQRVLREGEPGSWWRNGFRSTYVGVVKIPVKAQLGVDLRKIRIHETPENRLVVSGLTMTTIVDTAEGAQWLLDEVRTEFVKQAETVRFKGTAHDRRAKEYSRQQEAQVRARLKQGLDFKVYETGLIRAAEQVLRVLLSPAGKELVFESEPSPDSRELFAYLAEHNARVTETVAELKSGLGTS
jgi:hypothetical protein